jgi:Methylene-tetrahydrofolate reductase C terminal
MYAVRLWSVRHARLLGGVYAGFERLLRASDPWLCRIGYDRLERPVAAVERGVKGLLFDCRMCGQCALGSTGLSCPMNCPKGLRNGPCGGVRPDGHCEVEPTMRCVWVEAWTGSRQLSEGDAILSVQKPVDHRLWGRSAWLGVLRDRRGGAPAKQRAA